jgi:hypothetical protein
VTDQDAPVNQRPGISVAATLQRLVANGVIGRDEPGATAAGYGTFPSMPPSACL